MGLLLRTVGDMDEEASPAERTGHLLHPLSAGLCVPLFALFAAGVSVSGNALGKVFTTPEPLGVIAGLVAGKILGIFAGTYLAARFTRARLAQSPRLSRQSEYFARVTKRIVWRPPAHRQPCAPLLH